MAKVSVQPPARPASTRNTLVWGYGALLIVMGGLALFTPLLPPLAAGLTFGGLLIVAGLVGFMVLATARIEGFVWRLLWVAVATLTGLAVLIHHWTGVSSLPLILGGGVTLLGLIAVGHGARRHGQRPVAWRWSIIAALLTIGLGGLLSAIAPHGGLMVLGLFLAVNLVVFGLSIIAVGLARSAAAEWL